jgi:DNA invertase Pin-like site-specific DNA recombinase
VLVVTRLDRLARSTRDLLNVLDQIGKRGAGFKSLKDTWADRSEFFILSQSGERPER